MSKTHCSDPLWCWRCNTEKQADRWFDMAKRWKALGDEKEAKYAERRGIALLAELSGIQV